MTFKHCYVYVFCYIQNSQKCPNFEYNTYIFNFGMSIKVFGSENCRKRIQIFILINGMLYSCHLAKWKSTTWHLVKWRSELFTVCALWINSWRIDNSVLRTTHLEVTGSSWLKIWNTIAKLKGKESILTEFDISYYTKLFWYQITLAS